MLLEKSPRSSCTAIYYENHELEDRIREFFDPMFQKLDPNITFLLDFEPMYPEMYISCLVNNSNVNIKAKTNLLDMGFSDDSSANFETALDLMCPRHTISYSTVKTGSGIIIEFNGEGIAFLKQMDNFYETIGEMTREEAAAEVARLASVLRKDLKWS